MIIQWSCLYDDGAKCFSQLFPKFHPLWSFDFCLGKITAEGFRSIAAALLKAGQRYSGTITLDLDYKKMTLEGAQSLANCFCYSSAKIKFNQLRSIAYGLFSEEADITKFESGILLRCVDKIKLINQRNDLLEKYKNQPEKLELIKQCFSSVDMFRHQHASSNSLKISDELQDFYNSELKSLMEDARRINTHGKAELVERASKVYSGLRTRPY